MRKVYDLLGTRRNNFQPPLRRPWAPQYTPSRRDEQTDSIMVPIVDQRGIKKSGQ